MLWPPSYCNFAPKHEKYSTSFGLQLVKLHKIYRPQQITTTSYAHPRSRKHFPNNLRSIYLKNVKFRKSFISDLLSSFKLYVKRNQLTFVTAVANRCTITGNVLKNSKTCVLHCLIHRYLTTTAWKYSLLAFNQLMVWLLNWL